MLVEIDAYHPGYFVCALNQSTESCNNRIPARNIILRRVYFNNIVA
jgi:hypothetical protein